MQPKIGTRSQEFSKGKNCFATGVKTSYHLVYNHHVQQNCIKIRIDLAKAQACNCDFSCKF